MAVVDVRVEFDGELDFSDSLEVRRSIGKAIVGSDGGRVVLDFSKVTFIDSVIVGTLAHCHQRAAEAGVVLLVENAAPRVRDSLRLCGLVQVLGPR